jgi:hypothetical protein
MADVSVSLWLPVGRANFYSVTANGWMKDPPAAGQSSYSSKKINNGDDYLPVLQCSVLRRLLEVLPLSFGYDVRGECEMADEDEERSRPVALIMTLSDVAASLQSVPGEYQGSHRRRQLANTELQHHGVRAVRMRADEHGNYTFTGSVLPGYEDAAARKALVRHACEVFGGDFAVKRFEAQSRRGWREGAAAVRRYNGLTDVPTGSLSGDVKGPPAGALTFFQLNTLVEGICNETLWPAVFFERYDFMRKWLKQTETVVSILHTIADIIDILHVDRDAQEVDGQIAALRHFLAVTSRESLQRVKWSVESVRRSLLDEMMSVLHRQSRLIQLDLGAVHRERAPELAVEASESQLRGYVMLAAAKMPLIANVYEVAKLTVDHITTATKPDNLPQLWPEDKRRSVGGQAAELNTQLNHWKVLLDGLNNSVHSLESAVQQAWMERVLYEEQQSRSEQEAMAEIERSRLGRPSAAAGGRSIWDGLSFLIAVFSVLFVVFTTPLPAPSQTPTGSRWDQLVHLWPIPAVAVLFYFIIPGGRFLWRWAKERTGRGSNFSYEFAFLLDEPTDPFLVTDYVRAARHERVKECAALIKDRADASHDQRLVLIRDRRRAVLREEQARVAEEARRAGTLFVPAPEAESDGPDQDSPEDSLMTDPATPYQPERPLKKRKPLKGLTLVRLGGGRIERISGDNSSLKLHSVVTFRVAPFKYARFEVVKEILANRVSDQPRYFLHQVRMFGDSSRPVEHDDIVELIDVIFGVVVRPMASDDRVDDPLTLLRVIYN